MVPYMQGSDVAKIEHEGRRVDEMGIGRHCQGCGDHEKRVGCEK